VLEALGLKVNRLIRLSYGPFALGTLAPGEVEEVGPRVIREQLAQHIAPQNLPKGDGVQWKGAPKSSPSGGSGPKGRRGPADSPPQSAARTAPPEGEHPKKKVYKPGWAKAGKPKTFRGAPSAKPRNVDRSKGPRR